VDAHLCCIRPLFADTDAAGVVYYATFLRYLEEARTQAVESVGVSMAAEVAAGALYPVTHVSIDYQSPAVYGRAVCIATEVTEIGRARFRLDHRVFDVGGGQALARATVWLACIDAQTRRPRRLPPTMAAALVALRAGDG